MQIHGFHPSPVTPANVRIDRLHDEQIDAKGLTVDVLRLDLIHPVISGNKWFKLKHHLLKAQRFKYRTVVTFGGAYSNHLHACAYAAALEGFSSVGIVRGEQPAGLNNTLRDALSFGMRLQFVTRQAYDHRSMREWREQFPDAYVIDEGGQGPEGVLGAAEIAKFFQPGAFTHVAAAVGTGTMIAGLHQALDERIGLIGISAVSDLEDCRQRIWRSIGALSRIEDRSEEIRESIGDVWPDRIKLIGDYTFGGYARHTGPLLAFIHSFLAMHRIPTDFVYTAKLCYGVLDMIRQDYFPESSRILIIHSGGLQGNRSIPDLTNR